jgi:SnoaL-like polyketide cyclase
VTLQDSSSAPISKKSWAKRRLDRRDELLDPEFRSHAASGGGIDREQSRATVAATVAAFPDLEVTIEEQVAERDLVDTLDNGNAPRRTLRDRADEAEGSGRSKHMHRVRNDRFIDHWEVIDLYGLLTQLTRTDA